MPQDLHKVLFGTHWIGTTIDLVTLKMALTDLQHDDNANSI